MLRTKARAVPRGLNPALHPWSAESSPYREGSVFKCIICRFQNILLCWLSQNKHQARARCWEFRKLETFSWCTVMLGEIPMSQHPKLLMDMAHLMPGAFAFHVQVTVLPKGFKHFSVTALKALVAFLSLSSLLWSFTPPHPMAQEPHFSSAWGSWSLPIDAAGVPISSPGPGPVCWVDPSSPRWNLVSYLVSCCSWMGSLDSTWTYSSLASSGVVNGLCHQQLALPAMSSSHGTAPLVRPWPILGSPWVPSCPSLLRQLTFTAQTPLSLAFCSEKIIILHVKRTKACCFSHHCNVSAKVLLIFCITMERFMNLS